MTRIASAAVASIIAASAQGGGLDRSFQNIAPLFDEDGTFGVQLTHVMPSLDGTDVGGNSYSADDDYTTYQWSYVQPITDRFSIGIIGDQPYGLDLDYDAAPSESLIGGTSADLNSDAVSVVGRFKAGNGFSAYGGLRFQRAGGEVRLNGQGYAQAFAVTGVTQGVNAGFAAAGVPAEVDAVLIGGAAAGDPTAVGAVNALPSLDGGASGAPNDVIIRTQVGGASADFLSPDVDGRSGYEYELDEELETGYVFGLAYEIPEIAFRASITYFSEVTYENDASERIGIGLGNDTDIASTTSFQTPQAINIDVQSGVAEGTLVFAGLRWTDYDDFAVIPTAILQRDLADIDDVYRWTLGAARQFTPSFVGLAALTYEQEEGGGNTPLAPTDGLVGLSLGGRYTHDSGFAVSGGVNYSWLGDTEIEVGDTVVAEWEDNHAVGVSLRATYEF